MYDYKFSNKLKTFSIVLIILGVLGVGYSFLTSHKTLDEVKTMLAEESSGHGTGHGEETVSHDATFEDAHENDTHGNVVQDETHENEVQNETHDNLSHDEGVDNLTTDTLQTTANDTLGTVASVEGADEAGNHENQIAEQTDSVHTDAQEVVSHSEEIHDEAGDAVVESEFTGFGATETNIGDAHHDEAAHGDEHAEHVQHQIANRPWSALYVAAFFFMMIALGVLAFYAIQIASQAGWSPVLFRVMEGITAYLLPGALIVLGIALASGTIGHYNLFVWMDPEVVEHDKLIQGKSSFLNLPWFIIRGLIFIAGWSLYRHFSRKFSIAQDTAEDGRNFKKGFRISAAFLVFFIYTESMMSWDWIMSVDPHWFSTLFGWYVFASMFVSGITVIALITIYMKSRGYLEFVNENHLHDVAKYMFAFSIFWTYLWFSQFMLIWYSNIPEEVTYFVTRFGDYKLPFLGMVVMNFVFPLLMLMNADYKRIPWFVIMAGLVVLTGHYLDIFVMIMPATVGDRWFIGIPEISSILLFAGLFILVVFTALTKAPLLAKGYPFMKESKEFHY